MGKRSSRKRQRQSDRAETLEESTRESLAKKTARPSHDSNECHDLFVPLVSSKNGSKYNDESESSQVIQRQVLLHRLGSIGYSVAALCHTVFGAPHGEHDRADHVLPMDNPAKINVSVPNKKGNIRTIRRLHTVVENLSDVGLFVRTSPTASGLGSEKRKTMADLIQGYDLVSLAPGNDLAFQAACATATAAEIITLDYSMRSGGGALPFRVRSADVRAAIARDAVFEIPYAPAILNAKYRKKLIQCCRDFQTASAGMKPRLIFSSGVRSFQDQDGNTVQDGLDMSLRSPGDMKNLICVMLGFHDKVSSRVFSDNANFAVEQGLQRRFGNSIVRNIRVDTLEMPTETDSTSTDIVDDSVISLVMKQSADVAPPDEKKVKSIGLKSNHPNPPKKGKTGTDPAKAPHDDSDHSADGGGDGFIAF